MTYITDEQYGELCDLFSQALSGELEPDLNDDRMRFTGPQARRYAALAAGVLGFELEPDAERAQMIQKYLEGLGSGAPHRPED